MVCKYAHSPEPSLLTYTNMDVDEDSDQNLDLSLCWKHQHGRPLVAFVHMGKNQQLMYWPKCGSGNLTDLVCDLAAAALVVIGQPFLCLTMNVHAIRNSI